jgi:choline dehydrogenase-like flavoprotein
MSGSYDVVVAGAGTAGCVVAARLAADAGCRVALVDGGPDFGPLRGGGWPAPLLAAPGVCLDHFRPGTNAACDATPWVVGGGSSVNGGWAMWGAPADYAEWAGPSMGRWSAERMAAVRGDVEQALHVRTAPEATVAPWFRAVLEAADRCGIPVLEDVNAPGLADGAGVVPVNVKDRVRWTTAFSFLDPVRGNGNLDVLADTLIDRVLIKRGRVRGLQAVRCGRLIRLRAPRVVLAAGAFNSPAVLLRSGIGPAGELARLGIEVAVHLPAVGRHLADHPGVGLFFRAAPAAFDGAGAGPHPATVVVKARSGLDDGLWDLHLVPAFGRDPSDGSGAGQVRVWIFAMKPRSQGRVTLRSADPADPPLVRQHFLTDEQGHDRAVLAAGADLVRRMVRQPPAAALAANETGPSARHPDSWIDQTVKTYWHPAGTCRMGSPDSAAVDPCGRVHGVDGLHVADASVLPAIPRANTHLTVVAVATGLAGHMTADATH